MIRATTILAGILILGLAQFAPAQSTTQPSGVSGTYKWTTSNFGNEMPNSMTLKQDGDKLTGTITGFGGEDTPITEGKVSADGEISFKVVRDFGGQPITTMYSGKVSGDSFKGKQETVITQTIDAKRGG